MDIRLDQTTLETCPFGELRHGAAAFEAVVAHGRADGGGEVPIAATCVHVDEALSQRLGQSARSLAFAWVSPEGMIPATHIWPLRPTQDFQQWARRALRRINCNASMACDSLVHFRTGVLRRPAQEGAHHAQAAATVQVVRHRRVRGGLGYLLES